MIGKKKLAAVLASVPLVATGLVVVSTSSADAAACTTMSKRSQVEGGMRMQRVHDILDTTGTFVDQVDYGWIKEQRRLYDLCDLSFFTIDYEKSSPSDDTWQVIRISQVA